MRQTRQQVLNEAIAQAKQASDTLAEWIKTLEHGKASGMLSRDEMMARVYDMERAGLGSVGFLNNRFADDVFEAMTGERP